MKIPPFIMLVGSLCCSPGVGAAVVITTLSSTAPIGNVEASNNGPSPAGLQWRYDIINGRRDIGQSFLAATSFTFDRFSLQLQQFVPTGAPDASFTVSIYENSTQAAVGTSISTQSGVLGGLTAGSGVGSWLTFDIENLAVVSGRYYTFMLSFDSQVANQTLNFNSINPGAYAGGMVWLSTNGTTFTSGGVQDIVFSVQSIPEPSTVAVLSLAFLALVGERVVRSRRACH